MGTPAYMSPEQWRAENLTPSADQYALGIMTYAMVTGRVPFEAPTPFGMMHKHLNEQPTPPQLLRPDVPASVAQVLEPAFASAFAAAVGEAAGSVSGFFTQPIPRRPALTAATNVVGSFVALPLASHAADSVPALPGAAPAMPAMKTSTVIRLRQSASQHPLIYGLATLGVVAVLILAFVLMPGGTSDHGSVAEITASVTATSRVIVILPSHTPESILPTATSPLVHTPHPTGTPTQTDIPLIATSRAIVILPSDTPESVPATETAPPTKTPRPTDTETPIPTDTPDLAATAEAMLAERLTQTATLWTDTPTPNLEETVIAAMTGTAASWTATPSSTRIPTLIPTATSTPTIASTFTLIPTQTASYTPRPTATSTRRPTSTPRPSNTPIPYLHVGGQARVYVEDEGLKLRAGPGTNYDVLENMPKGTIVTLIGDPTTAQGYNWWRVRSPNGREGWAVAYADGLQTLIPLPD
jgi:serine/threonine protein kinase